jgi:AcrR family transcriptional regulator
MVGELGDLKKKPPRRPPAARTSRNYDSPIAQRILEVALPQFAERGFDNVTVRGLARDAGLELPSIYYQFRDKRELYLKCWEEVVAKGNEGPLRALKKNAPPEVRLYLFLVETAAVTLHRPHLVKFIMRQLLEGDSEGLHLINDGVMHDLFDRLLATIEEATGRPATMLGPIAAYSLNLCMNNFASFGGRMEEDLSEITGTPEALARYVMKMVYPEIAERLAQTEELSGAIQSSGKRP